MFAFSKFFKTFSFAFFALAFFLSFFHEASAAHTFDTFAQSTLQTTNPATLSYTAGSGTTVLVVMLAHTQASRTGGAPTYNGITMSQVGSEVLNAQEVGVEMWYLIDPPTGSAYTISVPNTGAGSVRIYGANFKAQSGYTSVLDVSNTTNTDAANPSLALTTTVNGAAVIDILADGDPDVPTGRSHTLIANADENQRTNEAQYALQATAGLITLSHTIPSDDVAMIAAAFKEVAKTTTLGNGTDPSNASLAPGGTATMADAFTFQTNTGTDSIAATVVGLASGTSGGLSLVEITNDTGLVVYGSAPNPATDTPSISLSGLTATTVSTQYKIRVTPKSHANMSSPPGSTYSVTAKINSFTGTNSQAGSDTAGTTVTIDNLSPANATTISGSAGNAQVVISWMNPADGDFHSTIVLRRASSAIADIPEEGMTYSAGDTIGTATVACVVTNPTATCTDSSITNGTAYHYKVFTRDMSVNYATGIVPTGSPFTPSLSTFTITATAGTNGSIAPSGAVSITQGADQTFTITPNTGYNINTLVVDSVSVATSTSYAFTDVQANHTIETTFIAIPTPPGSFSIAATAGSGGLISPSGLITVTQGDSQTFTITPDTGYNINTLVVDSVSIATSTSYTFTNVQANHTIAVTFVATEAVAPTTTRRILRPITVTFSGKAFPSGKVSIVDKEIASGKMTSRDFIAHLDGAFYISFVDIIEGAHTFGILAKDKNGRSTQSKFYTLELSAHQLEERNILLPPTIDLVRGQVSRGKNATVIGSASPDSTLRIEINGILTKEISTETDGSYRAEIPTGAMEFGTYKMRARQYDRRSTQTSDYSPLRSLIVSRLVTAEADFSGDGKIDIQDWSIFLSRWTSKESTLKQSIDLNGDGKVSIADFSIFIRTIRRK